MSRKKSGWFFEPVRHSLASKGIKTGRKQRRPIAGRYAGDWPKRKETTGEKKHYLTVAGKPLTQQVETDPEKKWFWGIRMKPAEKREVIREAVREEGEKRPLFRRRKLETKPESVVAEHTTSYATAPQEERKVKIDAGPPKSVMRRKSKSKRAKFTSIEEAWEAAQDELAQRYGADSSSSSGVVKSDEEAEQKLARSMGVH